VLTVTVIILPDNVVAKRLAVALLICCRQGLSLGTFKLSYFCNGGIMRITAIRLTVVNSRFIRHRSSVRLEYSLESNIWKE